MAGLAEVVTETSARIVSKERLMKIFEKGLRTNSELVTYGPEEVARAAAWGCIEHLLTVQSNLSQTLTDVIKDAGGNIQLYSDAYSAEHAILTQFTGTVAILRFPMGDTDEYEDDSNFDNSDSDDTDGMVIINPAVRRSSQTHHCTFKNSRTEMQCLKEPLRLPNLLPWSRATNSDAYLDEDVEDELEAINEIFPPDGSDITDTRAAVLRATVDECYLLVRNPDTAKAACLKVRLPRSYLSASPAIEVLLESGQGLNDPADLVSKCRDFVHDLVATTNGEPVLYELIEYISEIMTE